jgi:Spy/CpxP family protein refolding chaperone
MQGIIAGLKLTPGQKVKMQKIEQASQPRLQAIFMNNKLTPDQKRTQAFPIMETERKQFMAILTPAQKAKLMAEMQATPGRKGGPSH